MRNFVISLVCLLLIICSWTLFDINAEQKTGLYENALDDLIYDYIETENWNGAKYKFDIIYEDWCNYQQAASFFLDSSALSHIENTFKKASFYISAEDKSNSSGEIAYLIGLFETLDKNESITIENIF